MRATCLLTLAVSVAAAVRAVRAEDGIVLMVQQGHSPGQVILSWSGPGNTFDVHRGTTPPVPTDPETRLDTTASLQWSDQPPDVPIQYYTVTGSDRIRRPVDVLEPYVFLLVDSSGSLSTTTGFGPPGCPGGADTRLDHIRCAVAKTVEDQGDAVFGLGRFRLTTTDSDCADGCVMTGTTCTGCDPSTGAGCTTAMGSDGRFEVLAPLLRGGQPDLIHWNDFTCGTCTTDPGSNPEFSIAGMGPIAGALRGVRRYWQGLQALDGTTLWPAGPGFDPIRADPLRGAFLPGGGQCRPYLVVTIVDGNETCSAHGDGTAAAAALLATDVDGSDYRIETRLVGFGVAPGDSRIEDLAHAGGAADLPGAGEARYPRSSGELTEALTELLRGATRSERCNGADDDCDGIADEEFPGLGAACDDGVPGVCRATGYRVCRSDGAGTECHLTAPGASPSQETCNFLDDDCDGAVDEGCGGCAAAEICGDALDNDCDGAIDDGCSGCIEWVDVGGGLEIMRFEASRPDATPNATGDLDGGVCSRAGVQPWTDVSPAAAATACAMAGARLCTEPEWHRACAVVRPQVYPVVEPAANNGLVDFEAEDHLAATSAAAADGVKRAFVPDSTTGFSSIGALAAGPDTGAAVAAAAAPTQSPRMDYAVTFTQPGLHYVWVRGFATGTASDSIHVGLAATPGTSAPGRTIILPLTGSWTWARIGTPFSVAAGTQYVSLFMAEDGFRVDRLAVTRSNSANPPTLTPATNGGDWAFASNPDSYVAGACNARDLDTDAGTPGDQDDILAAAGAPGGQCYANHGPGRQVLDLSGNVGEWTAARAPGIHPIRGGGSTSAAGGIACSAATVAPDAHFAPNVGFRCCR